MRSMRTLPCRRRGGSSVAPTRMPGPRDAGRARCTQAAALPAFGLDGSLFHHACRIAEAHLGARGWAVRRASPCRASAAAECTPCRRRAHDCSGRGSGSGSAPPYRRCGRRPWYAYGTSPRQYVMPDDLVAQRRALGPRASADLEFYWQNWCGRLNGRPMDPSVVTFYERGT